MLVGTEGCEIFYLNLFYLRSNKIQFCINLEMVDIASIIQFHSKLFITETHIRQLCLQGDWWSRVAAAEAAASRGDCGTALAFSTLEIVGVVGTGACGPEIKR